jgi:hypothetical protein
MRRYSRLIGPCSCLMLLMWILGGCESVQLGCPITGCGTGFISKDNPNPGSRESKEAMNSCADAVDERLLQLAAGRTEYLKGKLGLTNAVIIALTPVWIIGQGGPGLNSEDVCSEECSEARFDVRAKFHACMVETGWVKCSRGGKHYGFHYTPKRANAWVCDRMP